MSPSDTSDVTIYGASDDCIEFDGYIYGEAYVSNNGPSTVILTSPDGATLSFDIGFCDINPDGWGIRFETWGSQSPEWPIRFGAAPGRNDEGDPAVVITVPVGTTATCDGEPVR